MFINSYIKKGNNFYTVIGNDEFKFMNVKNSVFQKEGTMGESKIFTNNYDPANKILTGKIELSSMEKDDAKHVYDLTVEGLKLYSDYSDYILDVSNVAEVTNASLGYLMKALGTVKRTAGYMVLILKEDVLQTFMISNPEMFDYYAVFFNMDDAVKFIKSKR